MWEKIFTFAKAQVSAFAGGVVSYVVTVLLREVFLHNYPPLSHDISYLQSYIAVGVGETLGAIVNFTLNKTWALKSKGSKYKHRFFVQFGRFVFVVFQSILLKATGVHLLTKFISSVDFKIWLLFIYFLVSIGNYLLQRYWVFNRVPLQHTSDHSKKKND